MFHKTKIKQVFITLMIIFVVAALHCSSVIYDKDRDELKEIIKRSEKKYKSDSWQDRNKALKLIYQLLLVKKMENTTDIVELDHNDEYKRLVKLLLKATYDTHSLVQIEAINCISTFVPAECKKRICELSLKAYNQNVRWYAIKALALYNALECMHVFIIGLKSSDWLIREASIKGLLKYDSEIIKRNKVIPYIQQTLEDPNQSVIITTLNNLNIKDPLIYKKIRVILLNTAGSSINLLKAVLQSLIGYKLDDEVREQVTSYLLHRNQDVRLLSLRVLKRDQQLVEQEE